MNFAPDKAANIAGDPLAQGALKLLADDLDHHVTQGLLVDCAKIGRGRHQFLGGIGVAIVAGLRLGRRFGARHAVARDKDKRLGRRLIVVLIQSLGCVVLLRLFLRCQGVLLLGRGVLGAFGAASASGTSGS